MEVWPQGPRGNDLGGLELVPADERGGQLETRLLFGEPKRRTGNEPEPGFRFKGYAGK